MANPDTGQATVVITKNYDWVFNGGARVMGAGEGAASFEQRLGHEKNDGFWLVSDASFQSGHGQLPNPIVITDQGGGTDPAFVVTPNFQAQPGDSVSFTVATDLASTDKGSDTFSAEVYQRADDGWTYADTIATAAGTHTYTFDEGGEYRIKFSVNDQTPGADKASATIELGESPFFYSVVPLPDSVDITPAIGSLLANDVPGDGAIDDHSWTLIDGEPQPDGSIVAEGDYGTLTVAPDGTYTYTPSGTAGGTDVFTYTLSDADGDLSQATLTIDVSHTVIDPLGSEGLPETLPLLADEAANPSTTDATLAAFGADSDGDGIPDALESDAGPATTPLASADALEDAADESVEALLSPPSGDGAAELATETAPAQSFAEAASEEVSDLTILGMALDSGSTSPVDMIDELNKNKGDATQDG